MTIFVYADMQESHKAWTRRSRSRYFPAGTDFFPAIRLMVVAKDMDEADRMFEAKFGKPPERMPGIGVHRGRTSPVFHLRQIAAPSALKENAK